MEWKFNYNQLNQTAEQFWKVVGNSSIMAFHGAMGSGKTTFIHALCSYKHVKDVVGSPTFSIINEYMYMDKGLEWKIYHMDLYRLKDEEEARLAGVEDCFYNGHICLVEWPERAILLFPQDTVHVYIEAIDDQTRKLQIRNN